MRIIIVILIGLSSLISSVAHANLFDELEDERKQEVLRKLKDHLPKMITVDGGNGRIQIEGSVNGNNIRLVFIEAAGEIINLRVNYNNLTMSGITNNKRGEPSRKWFAQKRR